MLYLFHGPETFLAHQEIKRLSQNYPKKQTFDFSEAAPPHPLADLRAQLLQESLWGEKYLFILQNFFKKLTPAEEDGWLNFLSQSKDTVPIVVWEKDRLPVRKSKCLTFLFKNARALEFKPLTSYQLKNWIKEQVSSITTAAENLLIGLHGSNLWLLSGELAKLTLFADNRTINEEDVKKLCVSSLEESAFALTDAVGERNSKKALRRINRLFQEQVEPNLILGMLARQLRLLVLGKENALQKMHPFVRKKALVQSKNWSLKDLQKAYQHLTQIDYQGKIGADLKIGLILFLGGL